MCTNIVVVSSTIIGLDLSSLGETLVEERICDAIQLSVGEGTVGLPLAFNGYSASRAGSCRVEAWAQGPGKLVDVGSVCDQHPFERFARYYDCCVPEGATGSYYFFLDDGGGKGSLPPHCSPPSSQVYKRLEERFRHVRLPLILCCLCETKQRRFHCFVIQFEEDSSGITETPSPHQGGVARAGFEKWRDTLRPEFCLKGSTRETLVDVILAVICLCEGQRPQHDADWPPIVHTVVDPLAVTIKCALELMRAKLIAELDEAKGSHERDLVSLQTEFFALAHELQALRCCKNGAR